MKKHLAKCFYIDPESREPYLKELQAKTTKKAGTIETAFQNMKDSGKGGKDRVSGKKNKETTNNNKNTRRLADSITAVDAKYILLITVTGTVKVKKI